VLAEGPRDGGRRPSFQMAHGPRLIVLRDEWSLVGLRTLYQLADGQCLVSLGKKGVG